MTKQNQDVIAARSVMHHPYHLTDRELEVLALIARGCDTREIARALKTLEFVVESHLRRIAYRLQVGNRSLVACHPATAYAQLHQKTLHPKCQLE